MKIVCAWCNALIQEGDEPISHGMCPQCFVKHIDHRPASIDEQDWCNGQEPHVAHGDVSLWFADSRTFFSVGGSGPVCVFDCRLTIEMVEAYLETLA